MGLTLTELNIGGEKMTVKEADPGDIAFVFPSWMANARQLRNTRIEIFNRFYEGVVQSLLETEPVVILTEKGKDTIHAWACGRPPNILRFAYVPDKLRGHGFGRAVISAVLRGYPETIFVTSSPLSRPHHPRFFYNPFLTRAA
jgi:hypothetical protein